MQRSVQHLFTSPTAMIMVIFFKLKHIVILVNFIQSLISFHWISGSLSLLMLYEKNGIPFRQHTSVWTLSSVGWWGPYVPFYTSFLPFTEERTIVCNCHTTFDLNWMYKMKCLQYKPKTKAIQWNKRIFVSYSLFPMKVKLKCEGNALFVGFVPWHPWYHISYALLTVLFTVWLSTKIAP